MRINVYSQEITDEVALVSKKGTDDSGQPAVFHGVRMYLKSAAELHHTPDDDDRSGITFWLPRSAANRAMLARALRQMANDVLSARGRA